MLEVITPLILTYNESPNISRVLRKLTWAKRIVVVDSYSTDDTLTILREFPRVQVYQREFDTFASQCNFGLRLISTDWALSLDADYVLTEELIDELKALNPQASINAYSAKFKYCIWGKPLRGTLYPPRKVLYRREHAYYEDDGHAHHVQVLGQSAWLSSYILHDDRKPMSRWLSSQDRYMIREVEKFRHASRPELSVGDKIRRRKALAPFIVLFYCLFVQRGILDGWAGWYYALQRMLAEALLAIRLIEDEQFNSQTACHATYPLPTANLKKRNSALKDININ